MFSNVKLCIPAMLLVGFSACGGGGGGNSGGSDNGSHETARAIGLSDFSVESLALTENEFIEGMVDDNVFYDNDPTNRYSDCVLAKESVHVFQHEGDGFYVLSTPPIDLSSCLRDYAEEGKSYSDRTLTESIYYRVKVTDEFGNIENLEGISLYLAGKIFAINVDIEYSYKYSNQLVQQVDDGSSIINESRELLILTASGVNADKNCERTNGIFNACVIRRKNTVTQNASVEDREVNLRIYEANNIEHSLEGTYFSGGTITFSKNNWDGVMTYDAVDTEKVPTYTATDGQTTLNRNFSPASLKLNRDPYLFSGDPLIVESLLLP
ncbi:hypothetical protein A9Q99_05855 [Gammaproteobacteria bacterium 45_16_T64]|nr:hypothetical protein A9Q99_05855 [Gammaproteobacteria bacterium 45_16_T64]